MSRFDFDRTRADPAFQAVMRTAEKVKDSCDRALCERCAYHRPGKEMLVVCFTEKLADELVMKGVIDRTAAEKMQLPRSRR